MKALIVTIAFIAVSMFVVDSFTSVAGSALEARKVANAQSLNW